MTELDLFAAAVATPDANARAALLDRECGDNPGLRARLEKLLAAHFAAHPLFDPVAEGTRSFAEAEPTRDPDGTHTRPGPTGEAGAVVTGKYTLVEPIGEGGMGAVWRAKQTEPVKRFVAVKLIKAGMDSKQVLARFEAERQALALMDHPNIAKVLDGGLHDGRPFFVMELVKGVPITDYCDAHKLTPQARLELFMQACQAIQHAHQKGVIHRDIKPSNVLVALYDDRPVVKVIDFGVAKATGGTLTEKTIDTGFGGVVGTPQYMSPEQATFNNLDIDTRSDVYALGVLLYELLTGSPPFSRKELEKKGLMEILRVVREEEPPRPSTKLSTADALPSVSANRGTEPKKLTGLLRNELDWIVMKALEKDRTRRYETANGFAADIQRYLTGEAVQAHPPSAGYRLRKFVRRNRGPVMAGSLVLLALLLGIAGTTFGLVRANRAAEAERRANVDAEEQKENAIRSATEARAKEAEANAVVQFFEEKVFAAGRPEGDDGGLGHKVQLRDAVRASTASLATSFKDQPIVEARLRQALGLTLFSLGDYAQATAQHERACTLYRQHLGPDHPSTLNSSTSLANDYAFVGRDSDAIELLSETLTMQKRVLAADDPHLLGNIVNLARSLHSVGRVAEAVQLLEEKLPEMKAKMPGHRFTRVCMHTLATCYTTLQRRTDAIKLFQEVLAAQNSLLPQGHRDVLQLESMTGLAVNYAAMNRHTEAITILEEALSVQQRVLPPDHVDTLSSMGNLAISYFALNRQTQAIKLYEETIVGARRVLGPDHPMTLHHMHNLAASYVILNRNAEAAKLYEEVLAARKRVLAADHPDTLLTLHGLANTYVNLNRTTEALPVIDEFLTKADRPGGSQWLISSAIALRIGCLKVAGAVAQCRATAESLEKRHFTEAQSLYNGACCWAMVASMQAKAKEPDAARLAREDADKAMTWLTKAVAAGWTDAAHIRTDTDLDPLRDRDDFKKLLADLEAKFPPKREVLPPPRKDK